MTERIAKQIGIAIVEIDGQYVVGTRQQGQDLAGLAEFPGGKCNSGEQPEDCAVRECFEETGLTVTPAQLLARTGHDYPHASVDLHFWLCRVEDRSDEPPHSMPPLKNGFQWKSVEELHELTFPDANIDILRMLTQ